MGTPFFEYFIAVVCAFSELPLFVLGQGND
jgi:hypothetical protein